MSEYRLYHLEGERLANAGRPDDLVSAITGSSDAEHIRKLLEEGLYGLAGWTTPRDGETVPAALERIFIATQNIDAGWAQAPDAEVSAFGVAQRSTSVGDVVVDPQGRAHLCANVGWTEIGDAPEALKPRAA